MTSQISLINYSNKNEATTIFPKKYFSLIAHFEIPELSIKQNNIDCKKTDDTCDYSNLEIHEFIKSFQKIQFTSIEPKLLQNNLILIDSQLPLILGEIMILAHNNQINSLSELTKELARLNPIEIDNQISLEYYRNIIKRLLFALLKGMSAKEVWSGEDDSIKIHLKKTDQESIFCSGLFNASLIEEYLFNNAIIYTPSKNKRVLENIVSINNKTYIKIEIKIILCS
jgi:hypothetical protein